jgi:hypothetical protein
MTNFVQALRKKRVSSSAVHWKFSLQYRKGDNRVYAFFESTDDVTFYYYHIAQALPPNTKLFTYICDGKSGVLSAVNFSSQKQKTENTIFFVDKDLDDFCDLVIEDDRVFCTEFYSIENYLCGDRAVEVIWREYVKLDVHDNRLKKYQGKLRRALGSFYTKMRPLMAWAVARRRAGHQVIFQNLHDLDCCFSLKGMKLKCRTRYAQRFRSACAPSDKLTMPKERKEWEAKFAQSSPKTWIRGKYEAWMFARLANAMWEGLVGQKISGKKKVKKTASINQDLLFGLAAKLPPPDGFSLFLSSALTLHDTA